MNPSVALIIVLLFLFIAAVIWLENRTDRFAVNLAKIIISFTTIAITGILGILLFVPEQTTDDVTVGNKITEIYTFSDNTSADDDSFIVVANNEYYYYYKTSSGIKQGKIPTNKTTVEFTNETPTLHTATKTTVRHTHWWWIFGCDNTYTDISYTLYVPKGAFSINIVQPNSD